MTKGREKVDAEVESDLFPRRMESEKLPGGWITGDGDFDRVMTTGSLEVEVERWEGPICR